MSDNTIPEATTPLPPDPNGKLPMNVASMDRIPPSERWLFRDTLASGDKRYELWAVRDSRQSSYDLKLIADGKLEVVGDEETPASRAADQAAKEEGWSVFRAELARIEREEEDRRVARLEERQRKQRAELEAEIQRRRQSYGPGSGLR